MKRRTMADKVREWEAGDLEAATAVLERPDAYGGEGSGIVQWARRVVERTSQAESARDEGGHGGVPKIAKSFKTRTAWPQAANKSNSGN